MIKGVDVSHYQGVIDFPKVVAGGWSFITAQITFGTKEQTPLERTDWANKVAKKIPSAGFSIFGGYHWLLPGNIEKQVDWFILRMTEVFGGVKGNICQLDVEWNDRLQVGPTYNDALAFAAIFAEKTGEHPLSLYYPRWYWAKTGSKNLAAIPNAVLWQADYRTTVTIEQKMVPFGGLTPYVLQYASNGVVPGVKTLCDVNVANGTVLEVKQKLGGIAP